MYGPTFSRNPRKRGTIHDHHVVDLTKLYSDRPKTVAGSTPGGGNCVVNNACVKGTCYDNNIVTKCDCNEGYYGENCKHPMGRATHTRTC